MRISDLATPRKVPPGSGWRKMVYVVSAKVINPGESPRERHYRDLRNRIRRHIRRQYVITLVSGKGGTGVTTMTAAIGSVFRECRPENVIAIDAVPGFGTLSDRIDEHPPGDYSAVLSDTDVQGYSDIREHLGQNAVGLDVLAGNRTSDQLRPLVPAMFSGVLSRLRRTHNVIIVDTAAVPSDRERDQLRRTASLLEASVQFADVSRPGTPLHDPGKLAAALDGVRNIDASTLTVPTPVATHVEGGGRQTGVSGPSGLGPGGGKTWR